MPRCFRSGVRSRRRCCAADGARKPHAEGGRRTSPSRRGAPGYGLARSRCPHQALVARVSGDRLLRVRRDALYNGYLDRSVNSKVDVNRPDPVPSSQLQSCALAEVLKVVNRQALRLQLTNARARIFGHGSDTGHRKDKGVSRQSPANPCHSWLPDLGSNQGPTD